MAAFYESVLDLTPRIESSGDIRLNGDNAEVVVHSIPVNIAKAITIRTPPLPLGDGFDPVW